MGKCGDGDMRREIIESQFKKYYTRIRRLDCKIDPTWNCWAEYIWDIQVTNGGWESKRLRFYWNKHTIFSGSEFQTHHQILTSISDLVVGNEKEKESQLQERNRERNRGKEGDRWKDGEVDGGRGKRWEKVKRKK